MNIKHHVPLTEEDYAPSCVGKSIAEIVHDYAVVRGDLSEQYARDQLVRIIEGRIRAASIPEDDATWALRTPSLWESPDDRSIPTLLAAIGQTLSGSRP